MKLWFHIYDYDQFDYEVILIPSQWGLFIGTLIPNQWGLFIGILIPKPIWVIHWYSDTQTNIGYSLVLWYPNQWGLFIGTLIPSQWGLLIGILIPKPMGVIRWYSDTQPMGVIHWYSDAQSRGYSVNIVIRLLRIWITFEYLNCFESLKLHIWFWKCLSIWTILSH